MKKLELIDSGILYINPDPAHYHVFASHAHPVQLSGREWLATFSRGDGMYAANQNNENLDWITDRREPCNDLRVRRF